MDIMKPHLPVNSFLDTCTPIRTHAWVQASLHIYTLYSSHTNARVVNFWGATSKIAATIPPVTDWPGGESRLVMRCDTCQAPISFMQIEARTQNARLLFVPLSPRHKAKNTMSSSGFAFFFFILRSAFLLCV